VTAARLEAPVTVIHDALVAALVTHADETSWRVNGTLHGLPVLSTNRLTAYFPHPKRGAEALDAFGLLSQFVGVLVHDHGSDCQRYQCLHAFCNAHHLREPIAIAERSPSQPWATDMITCQANAVVGEAQDQDLETLPASNGEHLRTRYDTILSKAEAGNPPHPRRPGTPRGGSNNPRPTTSFAGYANAATRSCASSPTCAFPSTTTKPNATCACPSSGRKPLAASAPIPAPGTLPLSAPTSQLSANNPTTFSTRSS